MTTHDGVVLGMTPSPLRVGVYGTGRVAGSLVTGLTDRAHSSATPSVRVVGVGGRDPGAVAELCARTRVESLAPGDLAGRSDLLILAVSDGAVAHVASDVADELPVSPDGVRPRWAVHCSGALGVDVLSPLQRAGLGVGCWHPLQAVADPTRGPRAGTTWTATTDAPELHGALEVLTGWLGGGLRPLDPQHRAAYHAAAVLASNHPAALVVHAVEVLVDCGFTREEAAGAAVSLARSALDALELTGVPEGVTGPVVRGDVGTVRRHLDALCGRPETRSLYVAASRALLSTAEQRAVEERTLSVLDAALGGHGNLP